MALNVGQLAPDFCLDTHLGRLVRLSDYFGRKNVVLVFFPLAWTPVWTSQIPSYQVQLDRFDGVQTQVLGLSVDSAPCLKAWAESLEGVTYPLLSDFFPHGQVSQQYGVLRPEGYSERAIFVIDKQGIIRYVDVHDIDEQPDNEELFRVLEELEPDAVRSQPAPEPEPEPAPAAEVVLYCTPWCPDCRRARAYLKENGIEFVEVDIIRNRAGAEQVRGWADGNETTPTIKIGDQVLIGFNRAKLDQIFFK